MLLRSLIGPYFLIGLCVVMLVCLEIGRRIRLSLLIKKKLLPPAKGNNGPVETVIFALLGLLIAFTFTGAGARFEARRQLITVEANAIGTAYLRIDLLPKEAQPQMRSLFKQYTLIRANIYKEEKDEKVTKTKSYASINLQKQIWEIAILGCKKSEAPGDCTKLVLPALNDMFDITTTQLMARQNHPPTIIYLMLIALSLFSALLVGYNLPRSNQRNLLYMISYTIIISLVLYLIIDLEMPRLGLITIHQADQVLLDLGSSM
ncbi:MAG TPA: hypothetical protein VKR58_09310 [Aquella sp.]|nr:hypothetical protein [Aquella sp.]